jgi:hypothetical protein
MKPIGIFNNALPGLADGQQAQLQLDGSGRLIVSAVAGAPTSSLYSAANVSVAASGDNTVIAGIAGQTIRLYALALTLAAPVDVALKDGATVLGTFQGVTALIFDPLIGNPRWVTSAGNGLVVNLAAAVACKGTVWFTQS